MLCLLTSIATLEGKWAIWAEEVVNTEERKFIFLISLLDTTTILYGIRERRCDHIPCLKSKIKRSENKTQNKNRKERRNKIKPSPSFITLISFLYFSCLSIQFYF